MAKKELTIEQKLGKFLKEAIRHLNGPEKDEDTCYLILANLARLSESLTEEQEALALSISVWFEDYQEKLRFCATDDDFHKLSERIKKNSDWAIDPDNCPKPDNNSDLTAEEILNQLTFELA
jgi:hypothetical protein